MAASETLVSTADICGRSGRSKLILKIQSCSTKEILELYSTKLRPKMPGHLVDSNTWRFASNDGSASIFVDSEIGHELF